MLVTAAAGTEGWLVQIGDAIDRALCGGKAVGLANLQRSGFDVPTGLCITTDFYRRWLERSGLRLRLDAVAGASDAVARRETLATIRAEVEGATLPAELEAALRAGLTHVVNGGAHPLAVRSSGVNEDDRDASHAGIHTSVVVPRGDPAAIVAAIKTCWASLWTDAAWSYRERVGLSHGGATMAVVVQRFVASAFSGVAFSADPLTGDRNTVVIEAVWGMGAALVDGKVTPDEFRVSPSDAGPAVVRWRPGRQTTMVAWRDGQETVLALDDARGIQVLTDEQALRLARLVKSVEQAVGRPVDVEWVFDGETFWAVQARPITTLAAPQEARPRPTRWTRANLKEVFPELPSPLALSYLGISLNTMFRAYHAANGYSLPAGTDLVSVIRGRPYLNLTLMQDLTLERGGDPAIVGRLFGGGNPSDGTSPPPPTPPALPAAGRARLAREMLATFFRTPSRGRRLFRRMRRQSAALAAVSLDALDDRALIAHVGRFGATLLHESTLRVLHEVVSAQSRAFMVLEALLTAWVPTGADGFLKSLMTGLGTLPNVRMAYRLMDLAALATQDPSARAYFTSDLDAEAIGRYRQALAGTEVLRGLAAFLREFGHRGAYESDVMSTRFGEDLGPVLRLVQLHVRAGGTETAAGHAADRRRVRETAMTEVRQALGQGVGRLAFRVRWTVFSIVCDALQRLLALRDECRHVTTMMVAHLRRMALEIGRRATCAGMAADPTDVFFLTWEELPRILVEPDTAWRQLTADRRRRRAGDAHVVAPDVSTDDGTADGVDPVPDPEHGGQLLGYGVSPGIVTGRVRVLHSLEGVESLSGEIVVFPTIEPTLTPIFPLVGGCIAEMGGLLSHAAILAREYGLPAVVSVRDATRRLRDGDLIELDGTSGRILVLERAD